MKNNNAKFAFLYMFSLVALLFIALGTGQIIFEALNKYIADFTTPYTGSFGGLTFWVASLIIAIPLYYVTMRYLEKSLVKGELDREAPIRRWLIYFILFVSSVVMVVWLIITISSFLNGELTSKFIFKALAAIVIAGTIFSYYLYDIRRESIKKNDLVVRIYFIASLVLCLGALVFSFFFVESPMAARARRHDTTVLDQFTQIDSALSNYYTKNKHLPDTLDQLGPDASYLNLPTLKDPSSGKGYDYHKLTDTSYQLCADFQSDNHNADPQVAYVYTDRWPHGTGYHCLKQNAINYNEPMSPQAKPVPSMPTN